MSTTTKLEIWEMTLPGRVTMTVTNSRGRPQEISAMGKGQRLRMTTEDRQIAEEGIRSLDNNPFRNGMLVRIDDAKDHVPAPDELSDEELAGIFQLDQDDFQNTVTALGEVNIRRLKSMFAEVDASKSEIDFVNNLIEERYAIGGSMPTYDEMQPTARR